jgi:DOMON domain
MLAVVELFCLFIAGPVSCNMWDHDIDLDENFRLLWSVKQQDIYFEVQVRTQGYVGLGFSRDGTIYGADMAMGWVEQGHAYFQVIIQISITMLGLLA